MTDRPSQVAILALNPSVDVSYEIPQLLEYQKVRAQQTWYHPGGNGINVARALTELQVPLQCCSVVAGESGDLLLKLLGDTLGDGHTSIRVPGETRLNTTVLQQHPPGQFEITSVGPFISAEMLADISGCFLGMSAGTIAVLTGLLPPGVPESTYRELAESIQAGGGRVVVDSCGDVLEQAIEARPWMVRLNRYALEMTVKRRLDSEQRVAEAGRELQRRGIDYLCVTVGNQGAVLIDSDNSYHCSAPKVHIQSTVGCGDSLVAGLVAAALNGEGSEAMLRFGVVCGSATASHPGTELFVRDELNMENQGLSIATLDI